MGHEAIGVIEDVGDDVRTLNVGDLVVMPFAYSYGSCAFCREALPTACVHVGFFGNPAGADGAQAEAVRIPVGDGAVGLCGVIAAKRLGAEQIIILGRHDDRIALAREFGATDVVSERGEEAVERVHELTGGFGAHSVLECVGTAQATETSGGIARPGGEVGRVGVPHYPAVPLAQPMFF